MWPFGDLAVSAIAALGSLLAAVLTQFLASRRAKEGQRSEQDIEKLAVALQSEEATRRAAALEAVAQRLPVGLSSAQVCALVEQITAKVAALVPASAKPHSAVEALINNYHEPALGQSRALLFFSVVAGTVGFDSLLYAGPRVPADNLATGSNV